MLLTRSRAHARTRARAHVRTRARAHALMRARALALTRSRAHALTRSRAHALTRSRAHALTRSRAHARTRARAHARTRARAHALTHSTCTLHALYIHTHRVVRASTSAESLDVVLVGVFFAHAFTSSTARRAVCRCTLRTPERATLRLAEVATLVTNTGCGIVSGGVIQGAASGLLGVQAFFDEDLAPALVLIAALSAIPGVAGGAVPWRGVPADDEVHAIGFALARAPGRPAWAEENVLAVVRRDVGAGGGRAASSGVGTSHSVLRRPFQLQPAFSMPAVGEGGLFVRQEPLIKYVISPQSVVERLLEFSDAATRAFVDG